MKERPILFSAPMVRDILAGAKTQTRRVLRPQPSRGWGPDGYDEVHKMRDGEFVMHHDAPVVIGWGASNADGDEAYACKYGEPGDRLWVREGCRAVALPVGCTNAKGPFVEYRADDAAEMLEVDPGDPGLDAWQALRDYRGETSAWVPPVHMPRWASRIVLGVADAQVERVQAIDDAGARAEGVAGRQEFAALWDRINAARGFGWAEDPWVWVLYFKVVSTRAAFAEHLHAGVAGNIPDPTVRPK